MKVQKNIISKNIFNQIKLQDLCKENKIAQKYIQQNSYSVK